MDEAFGLRPPLVPLEERLHRGDELLVVPRLREVIDGALLDELDRGLERRPRGHEEDRKLRVERAHLPEQRDPLLPARGPRREVHVLEDEPRLAPLDDPGRSLRPVGDDRRDVVEIEEDLKSSRDRGLILHDEHLPHRPHTVRVASDGGTSDARSAAGSVAMTPLIARSTTPPATRGQVSFTSETWLTSRTFSP